MYGGQSTYIPLKVNQSGVIPVIFASSLLSFPALIATIMGKGPQKWVNDHLVGNATTSWFYIVCFAMLILFFSYFYTAIAFNPQQQADIIRKQGGFIPGIRPGPPTERYLAKVLNRITLPGALFLTVDRVVPLLVLKAWNITSFPFGGTSILIAVGVMLETMKQIDSQLMMRNYEGFLHLSRMARGTAARALVLLGKQGAGKGTQATRLAEHYDVDAHFDRRYVSRQAASGHRVRSRSEAVHGRRASSCPTRSSSESSRNASFRAGRSATASCSTASRARCPRRASSTGARRPPLDLVDRPRRAARDRDRPHRRAARVRELPARVPREHAADGRLDLRHVRRRRASSATTTPKRRSSGGSSSTRRRPCRSSTTTGDQGLLVPRRRRRRRRRRVRATASRSPTTGRPRTGGVPVDRHADDRCARRRSRSR